MSESALDVTKAVAQMSTSLPAAEKKAARKKALKGWDPTFIKRNFFPYWRSVLGAQLSVSNGAADEKSMLHRPQFRNSVVPSGMLLLITIGLQSIMLRTSFADTLRRLRIYM
uniref:Uncharacterized protein n=1 Tax=Oryza nivara TaxID=4536 RepID=A0A0E0FYM9_ORYNI